jgi:hypothetical protein
MRSPRLDESRRKGSEVTTWESVKSFLKNEYKIAEEKENSLALIFETGNLRSQIVFIYHMSLKDGTEHWVQIESAIGKIADLDLPALLAAVGDTVVGGLGTVGEVVTIRHAAPLANLDSNELLRPLTIITATADRLEREFSGGDAF